LHQAQAGCKPEAETEGDALNASWGRPEAGVEGNAAGASQLAGRRQKLRDTTSGASREWEPEAETKGERARCKPGDVPEDEAEGRGTGRKPENGPKAGAEGCAQTQV